MNIEQFDTRLMALAHMIRICRNKTKEVTRPYPDHVRRLAESLEAQMLSADMIVGSLIGMLHESEVALRMAINDANKKDTPA